MPSPNPHFPELEPDGWLATFDEMYRKLVFLRTAAETRGLHHIADLVSSGAGDLDRAREEMQLHATARDLES